MSFWPKEKQIFLGWATIYEKINLSSANWTKATGPLSASHNGKLSMVFCGLFGRNWVFYSLFISVLVNTTSVSVLFECKSDFEEN